MPEETGCVRSTRTVITALGESVKLKEGVDNPGARAHTWVMSETPTTAPADQHVDGFNCQVCGWVHFTGDPDWAHPRYGATKRATVTNPRGLAWAR